LADSSTTHLIIKIHKIKMEEINPNLPISSAITSNFNYNGVGLSSSFPRRF